MRLALTALLVLCGQGEEPPRSYLTAPMLNDQEVGNASTEAPAGEESVSLVAEEGAAATAPPQPTEFERKLLLAGPIDRYIAASFPQCDEGVRQRLAVEFALAGETRYQDWCTVIHGESAGTWDPTIQGDWNKARTIPSSFGLFQINKPAHKNSFDFNLLARGDDLGVWYQVKCAIAIRKDSGWGAWTVARREGIR